MQWRQRTHPHPHGWTNQSTAVIAEFVAEIRKDPAIAEDLDRIAAHDDIPGWITAARRYVSGELERQLGPDHFGTRMAHAAFADADWRQLAQSNIAMVDAVDRAVAQKQTFVGRLLAAEAPAAGTGRA